MLSPNGTNDTRVQRIAIGPITVENQDKTGIKEF